MRRRPYTQAGVQRLPCFRCGAKACEQWTICADGNQYRPICKACDIALNALVLQFMRHPRRRSLMAKYRRAMAC